ncbi:MAG: FapA family protein [Propionivibrio sp.]
MIALPESFGLSFVQDGERLLATLVPVAERSALDADGVKALIAQAGFGKWTVSAASMATLLERWPDPAAELDIELATSSDASFSLEVAGDAMQAWASVIPSCGGQALQADDVFMALGAAGVTHGIDSAAVSAACALERPDRVLVASGTAAVDGEDTKFELLVSDARDRSPRVNQNGLIDFRDLGAIPSVSADEALMRRIPPTTGIAGRNVRGEVLEPVPGKNERFADKLIGAYVARDDANLLRAVFSGQPVRCGNAVNVEQILRIRNVNIASGNISFDGTVNVEGEVLPGMKVRASGDIIIGGVVDGAELDAGGDIRIAGGVIAKAQVRAGGSVSMRFVENALVTAGTTIAIDDAALQSELQANNQILVGIKSPQRGRLAGGSARAMLLIRTPILGSGTGGVTRLLLGVNPVLEAEYQELAHKIERQREEEQNLEKLVKHLARQPDKAALHARAKASWEQAVKAWARLLPQRDALEQQLALIAGARVEVGAEVAGAVDVTLGKKLLRLRKAYNAGTFAVEGERFMYTDPYGNSTVAA